MWGEIWELRYLMPEHFTIAKFRISVPIVIGIDARIWLNYFLLR